MFDVSCKLITYTYIINKLCCILKNIFIIKFYAQAKRKELNIGFLVDKYEIEIDV